MAVVQFKFEGSIALSVPYSEVPSGLMGQDAEAVRQWAANWWREHVDAPVQVKLDIVYQPEFEKEN